MSESKSRKFQSLEIFSENTFLGVFMVEKHDFDGFRGTFPRKNLSFWSKISIVDVKIAIFSIFNQKVNFLWLARTNGGQIRVFHIQIR